MISLELGRSNVLLNNNGVKEDILPDEAHNSLRKLRLGSNLYIKSDNIKVDKHSGDYYLLFMEEYEEVFILYLDKQQKLRVVFQGMESEVARGLYYNVADEMKVKILKSSNKKAYRVVRDSFDSEPKIIEVEYKNKSSSKVKKTYLTVYEAIKVATYRHNKDSEKYKVITPKGTVLYEVGY